MNSIINNLNPHPRRLAAVGVLLLASSLLAACEVPQTIEQQASTQAVSGTKAQEHALDGQSSRNNPVVGLGAVLKEGMAYADLRKSVLTQDWAPLVDPQCKVNLAGEDHEAFCQENSDLALCQACDNMPELSEYGNSGYARMWFQKGDEKLEVVANGMPEDWNVPGDDSRFNVSWWKVSESLGQDK